jgi:hypothetical protein
MSLRLRRPILGEDCPDAVKGVAEYTLMATVSHHGKHAAGKNTVLQRSQCISTGWLTPSSHALSDADSWSTWHVCVLLQGVTTQQMCCNLRVAGCASMMLK